MSVGGGGQSCLSGTVCAFLVFVGSCQAGVGQLLCNPTPTLAVGGCGPILYSSAFCNKSLSAYWLFFEVYY